jgi:3-hydroxyisobutyrate dehydrogenase-like beta-hydroxyacid dehydrogenase
MTEQHADESTIGFIGLGLMGSRIAGRLLEAGYRLGVYNRAREKALPLAKRGAQVYDTPRDLAASSDVVLSMVSDDAAVEQVLLGPEGALAGARPGTTLIDLSSVYPATSRKVWAAAHTRSVVVLDAAVSGSTPQAESGSLVLFVGGDYLAYEKHQSILHVLGKASFYLGPSGAGATMKLVVNALLGVEMQALAEAIVLGERAGLNKAALLNVLAQTAVITPGQRAKIEHARNEEYPAEFPLRLMAKDFGNILRLAGEHNVPVPATAVAAQVCATEQEKRIEEDFSAVIRTMEELAGVLPPRGQDLALGRLA